jgi:hypothetical protein
VGTGMETDDEIEEMDWTGIDSVFGIKARRMQQ